MDGHAIAMGGFGKVSCAWEHHSQDGHAHNGKDERTTERGYSGYANICGHPYHSYQQRQRHYQSAMGSGDGTQSSVNSGADQGDDEATAPPQYCRDELLPMGYHYSSIYWPGTFLNSSCW